MPCPHTTNTRGICLGSVQVKSRGKSTQTEICATEKSVLLRIYFRRRLGLHHSLGGNQFARGGSHRWPLHGKNHAAGETCESPQRDSARCTDMLRHLPGDKRTDRSHSDKHHRVHRHHASTQLVRHHGLDQCVGGGELHHHRVTCQHQRYQ